MLWSLEPKNFYRLHSIKSQKSVTLFFWWGSYIDKPLYFDFHTVFHSPAWPSIREYMSLRRWRRWLPSFWSTASLSFSNFWEHCHQIARTTFVLKPLSYVLPIKKIFHYFVNHMDSLYKIHIRSKFVEYDILYFCTLAKSYLKMPRNLYHEICSEMLIELVSG